MKLHAQLTVFFISSFFSIITLGYIGIAYQNKNRPTTIPYELFPIVIPILYGVFGVLNYYIVSNYGNHYSIVVGMVVGLLFSSIGRFGLDLPIQLFDFTKKTSYMVHIYALLLYAIIFRWIITPTVHYII